MRRVSVLVLLTLGFSLAGCDRGSDSTSPEVDAGAGAAVTPTPTPMPEGTITAGEVKQEVSEAAAATGAYLKDKGHDLRVWTRDRMEELRADLARMKQQAQSEAQSDTSALDKLQERLAAIDSRLENFSKTSSEKMDEARKQIDDDLEDIRLRISTMMNRDTTGTQSTQ